MSVAVDIEVVLLRWEEADGHLAYRTLRQPLPAGEPPDVTALLTAGCCQPSVSHSTSWRYQPDGTVVLTYAILPDPDPLAAALPLLAHAVVCSGDPVRPTPPTQHAHHVAAHAVRHLAYLAEHDPAIRTAAATSDPALWRAILAVAGTIPTGTARVAHSRAVTTPT